MIHFATPAHSAGMDGRCMTMAHDHRVVGALANTWPFLSRMHDPHLSAGYVRWRTECLRILTHAMSKMREESMLLAMPLSAIAATE